MALPATDTFTGTNGTDLPSYSANWSNNKQTLFVWFNSVTSSHSVQFVDLACRWNADTFPNNQYAQLTLVAVSANELIGPAVRLKTDNTGNFYGYYAASTDAYMFKVVNDIGSQLGSTDTVDPIVTDVLRLEASGTSITPYKNGVLNSTIGGVTDSAHSSGSGGVCGSGNGATTRGDSWESGSLDTKRWILGGHT